MPRIKCGKCQAVIKLDAVPADGSIQCSECGATFRVRPKASDRSTTSPSAPEPSSAATPPAATPSDPDQPDFSFAAAATPPAPKSGGGIDLGFLTGNQPQPASEPPAPPQTPPPATAAADASRPSFDFIPDGAAASYSPPATPQPVIKPGATKPKRKPAKSAAAPQQHSEAPLPKTPLPKNPLPDNPLPENLLPDTPLPEAPQPNVSSSPYASPAPAISQVGSGGSGRQAGGDLLAMPAPSFITGMFDGSFRYFLTPRIVKVFWILALVAAGIALTLVVGSYFLMLYGILVADVGLPDGQRYAAELDSDPAVVMQFQPGPSSRSSSFSTVGKLGTVLFSTLYTLASVTMILMWLLFLRMILEAFCVLFGIRVSLRTMAERS